MSCIDFLQRVMPVGYAYFGATINQNKIIHPQSFSTYNQLKPLLKGDNEYFAPAGFAPGSTERKQVNVAALKALWVDLDPDEARGITQESIQNALHSLAVKPHIVVDSGRGIQCYWIFAEPITPDAWLKLSMHLKAMMRLTWEGFMVDTSQWTNYAALMRLPGSVNHKTGREARVIYDNGHVVTDADLAVLQAIPAEKAHVHTPTGKKLGNTNVLGVLDGVNEKLPYVMFLTGCNLLRMAATNPELVPEPLWYRSLGVLHATREGVEAAQVFSQGHPGYDPVEVENKYNQWASNAEGIATCTGLRSAAPPSFQSACQTCKIYSERADTSPIASLKAASGVTDVPPTVALQTANRFLEAKHDHAVTQAAVQSILQSPHPTAVTNDQPLEALDRTVVLARMANYAMPNFKIELTTGSVVVKYSHNDRDIGSGSAIAPIRVYRQYGTDDIIFVKFISVRSDYSSTTFILPYNTLALCESADQSVLKTQARFISSTASGWMHVGQLLVHMTDQAIKQNIESEYAAMRPGWQADDTFVTYTGLRVTANTVHQCQIRDASTNLKHTVLPFDVDTDFEDVALDWFSAYGFLTRLQAGRAALAASFAAPLIAEYGSSVTPSLILVGDGGVFKTSSCRFAVSAWGHEDDTLMTTSRTDKGNGITGRLEAVQSVPVVVDEVTVLRTDNLAELISIIANGTSKIRRANTGNYEAIVSSHWMTAVLMTSNTSLVRSMSSSLDATGGLSENVKRRFLEITVPSVTLPDFESLRAEVATAVGLKDVLWGAAGAYFLREVIKDRSGFEARIRYFSEEIDKHVHTVTNNMDVQKTLITLMLAVADLLNERGLLSFDVDGFFVELTGALLSQARALNCIVASSADSLASMLPLVMKLVTDAGNHIAHLSRTGMEDSYNVMHYSPTRDQYAFPVAIYIYNAFSNTNATVMDADSTSELYIHAATLLEMLASAGLNQDSMIKSLTAANDVEASVLDHKFYVTQIAKHVDLPEHAYSVSLIAPRGIRGLAQTYYRIPKSAYIAKRES